MAADDIREDNSIRDGEFGGKNMLVAEDVEINREILLALLENTGLSIDCAENGEEAFKMVEASPDKYDIIFMDVQMPRMNGYEATRLIRAFEQKNSPKNETRSDNRYPPSNEDSTSFTTGETRSYDRNSPSNNSVEFAKQTPKLSERPKGVPIIALTANVFKSDIEDCIAAGMDDHLGKPLDIDRVIEKLREYLK